MTQPPRKQLLCHAIDCFKSFSLWGSRGAFKGFDPETRFAPQKCVETTSTSQVPILVPCHPEQSSASSPGAPSKESEGPPGTTFFRLAALLAFVVGEVRGPGRGGGGGEGGGGGGGGGEGRGSSRVLSLPLELGFLDGISARLWVVSKGSSLASGGGGFWGQAPSHLPFIPHPPVSYPAGGESCGGPKANRPLLHLQLLNPQTLNHKP